MDLASLVADMVANGQFAALAGNPLAQFGPQRQYLGATILPERMVEENVYRESSIRYRTVIANDGSRYSPAQLKASGELVGEFLVELGDQDIARQLSGRDYDALLRLLGRNTSMQAVDTIVGWTDRTVNQALVERTELQRWQAIVDASVVRVGDNGYTETVSYPNPSGHRAAAAGTWSSDAYDPYADITGMVDLLADKGYTVGRIITSRTVVSILARNAKIQQRAAPVRVLSSTDVFGRVGIQEINGAFQADGLPPIETYDLLYRDQVSSGRFLASDVMVFIANTGVDPTWDLGDAARFIPDVGVLGYTAIGRAVGQAAPGRVIRAETRTDKPPRIEAEGWQTSLPVITEPEAIAVVTGIS